MWVLSKQEVYAWALKVNVTPNRVVAVGAVPAGVPLLDVQAQVRKLPGLAGTWVRGQRYDDTVQWSTVLIYAGQTLSEEDGPKFLNLPGGPTDGCPFIYPDLAVSACTESPIDIDSEPHPKWRLPPNHHGTCAADCQPAQKNVANPCPGLAGKPEPRPHTVSDSVPSSQHSPKDCAAPPLESTRGRECREQKSAISVPPKESKGCREKHPWLYRIVRAPHLVLPMVVCPCALKEWKVTGGWMDGASESPVALTMTVVDGEECLYGRLNECECAVGELTQGPKCPDCAAQFLQPKPPAAEDTVAEMECSLPEDERDCQGLHPDVYEPWKLPGIEVTVLMCPCLSEALKEGVKPSQLQLGFRSTEVDGETFTQCFGLKCGCSRREALAWEPQCECCGAWFLKPILPQAAEPAEKEEEGLCAQMDFPDAEPEPLKAELQMFFVLLRLNQKSSWPFS
ncbi:uncharacterized protein LOC142486187 [Ascaphus truei]|uniref:uncharacterized protein LOC142486187 n=1 Tax=Ascaphus truei TaxID=8439 RepID=UPI003F5A3A56